MIFFLFLNLLFKISSTFIQVIQLLLDQTGQLYSLETEQMFWLLLWL